MPLYVPPPEQYHFEVVEVAMADPEMGMSQAGGSASVFSLLNLTPIESHSAQLQTKRPTLRDRQMAKLRQKLGLDVQEVAEPAVDIDGYIQEMFDGFRDHNQDRWGEPYSGRSAIKNTHGTLAISNMQYSGKFEPQNG